MQSRFVAMIDAELMSVAPATSSLPTKPTYYSSLQSMDLTVSSMHIAVSWYESTRFTDSDWQGCNTPWFQILKFV